MTEILGVVLAGGRARRLAGADKCLLDLDGRPILTWILDRFGPQVGEVVLNANGAPSRFASFALPVVADTVPDFPGPLAGILSAMEWAQSERPGVEWIASVAGDTPFIPRDLIGRFWSVQSGTQAKLVCAASGGRTHPVCGLWRVDLAGALRDALTLEGIRKVDLWTARYSLALAEFPSESIDPFFNVNGPEDLAAAEAIVRSHNDRRS